MKMGREETVCEDADWIHVAQKMEAAPVNTLVNLQVPQKAGYFMCLNDYQLLKNDSVRWSY